MRPRSAGCQPSQQGEADLLQSKRKTDKLDAEKNLGPALAGSIPNCSVSRRAPGRSLPSSSGPDHPVHSREALIRSRERRADQSRPRGTVKSFGARLPKFPSVRLRAFTKEAAESLPEQLQENLQPVVEIIASLTEKIKDYDQRIEALVTETLSAGEPLAAGQSRAEQGRAGQSRAAGCRGGSVEGCALRADDPGGSAEVQTKSRAVGAYLGLAPGNNQSGDSDPQKRICREGDEMLRRL